MQELTDIRAANSKIFRNIVVDETNILYWNGLVVPVSPLAVAGVLRIAQSCLYMYATRVPLFGCVGMCNLTSLRWPHPLCKFRLSYLGVCVCAHKNVFHAEIFLQANNPLF